MISARLRHDRERHCEGDVFVGGDKVWEKAITNRLAKLTRKNGSMVRSQLDRETGYG